MKTKKLYLLLLVAALATGGTVRAGGVMPSGDKSFEVFLQRFTSSAAFQYSRIKFPLKTPISLMSYDGENEKSFPFTKEKWMLLTADMLKVGATDAEGGGRYIGKYVSDTPTHKEFQAGYEDSEMDLQVVFDLIGGQWYVTDAFEGCYSYDMSTDDLQKAILEVQRENVTFKKLHP
jgi:hypothetical protein